MAHRYRKLKESSGKPRNERDRCDLEGREKNAQIMADSTESGRIPQKYPKPRQTGRIGLKVVISET
jgi:hypothetical protein